MTVETQTMEQRIVQKVLPVDPQLTFTVEIRYHPDDSGYLVECFEVDAFAWGDMPEEAVENLLDVLILIAETLSGRPSEIFSALYYELCWWRFWLLVAHLVSVKALALQAFLTPPKGGYYQLNAYQQPF